MGGAGVWLGPGESGHRTWAGPAQERKEQPLQSAPQLLRMPPSLLPSRSWRAWGSPAFSTVLAAELERAEAPPCPTEKSQQRGRPPWPQAPAGWAGRLGQSEFVNPVPSPLIPRPPDSREEVVGVASTDYPDFQGQGLAHSSRGHNTTFCFKKADPSLLDPEGGCCDTAPRRTAGICLVLDLPGDVANPL